MPKKHQSSLLPAVMQGARAMKIPPIITIVLILCITVLIFTYFTRETLCELRWKSGDREVAAFMAYESGK
ncbi:protein HokB [Erwinia sp. JUb26]|nr:protein HokB [Erwinia sp. JUb26]